MEANRSAPPGGRDQSNGRSDTWLVGGEPDCDHPVTDAVSLGLGAGYAYERCRGCGGVVVARLGD